MLRLTPARRAIGIAALVGLAVAPAACTGWRAAHGSPAAVVRQRPAAVRVVRAAGDTVEVVYPTIQGDSLIGARREAADAERVAIALADVRTVETRQLRGGRTLGGVAVVALVAGLVYAIVVTSALAGGGY